MRYNHNEVIIMEICSERLLRMLRGQEKLYAFLDVELDLRDILRIDCCRILEKIKSVVKNQTLSDYECTKEIVRIIEEAKQYDDEDWGEW